MLAPTAARGSVINQGVVEKPVDGPAGCPGVLEGVPGCQQVRILLVQFVLEPIAARLGISVDTLRRRMQRIDTRIADALTAGLLTGVAAPLVRQQLTVAARKRERIRASRAKTAARPASAAQVPAAA